MGFSLPNFLRRTPPAALEQYFAACGFCGLEGVNWTTNDRALLGQVREAVEALPDHDRERVFDDFERAAQLCNEIGQRALQSVLADELREAVRAGDPRAKLAAPTLRRARRSARRAAVGIQQ